MLRFEPRSCQDVEQAALAGLKPYEGITAQLLLARGIADAQAANAFMHPHASQLHDPFLLLDMDRAITLIHQANTVGWSVVVYGDYDVDGTCPCTLLTEALGRVGVQATPPLPRRREGYGLPCAALEPSAEEPLLMLTVGLCIPTP